MSTSLLELIALPAEGIEWAFHRMPLIPGVHLRWSFRPDLGFPPGGFQIYRRLYRFAGGDIPTPPTPGAWELIHTVLPPASLMKQTSLSDDAIAERIAEYLKSPQAEATTSLYRAQVLDLVRVVRELERRDASEPVHRRRLNPDRPDAPFSLRALDALLLASLDPYIARMLGLYWIDGVVPPGRRVDYRLVGLWGTTPYPVYRIDFRGAGRRNIEGGHCELDEGVSLFSERTLALDGSALLAAGAPGLQVRFSFPRPVQEVELAIGHTESNPRWRAFVQVETLIGDHVDVSSAIQRVPGGIRIEHTAPFNRLLLTDESSSSTTLWRIEELRFRERTSPIGSVTAETRVNPSAALVEDPPDRPAAVSFRSLQAKSAPPSLDERGRIPLSDCRIEVYAQPSTLGSAKYTPVRMHLSRLRQSTTGEPPLPLTESPAVPYARAQVAAFWRLSGQPDDRWRTDQGYTVVEGLSGSVRFDPFDPEENPRRRYATFSPWNSQGRVQGGFLEVRAATLRELGSHLFAEVWVFPLSPPAWHGSNIYTLFDNSWQQSFWLGLRFASGGFVPRLWLNGQMFESTGRVVPSVWSRVAFRYDGKTVRFYINGSETNTIEAALGPVRANPRGDLFRIGASLDANPTNFVTAAYPYVGSMMNLRIERNAYAAVSGTAAGLLAAWTLDGEARDLKTGLRKTASGSVTYEQGHPESLARRVARFNGSSWLFTDNHPAFSGTLDKLFVDLWVNPEPGQTFPTLVGNAWTHSFWLGLSLIGTDRYRVRLWINGAMYESNGDIPPNQWSRVGAAYDGETVRIFIDGRVSAIHTARHGPVRVNPTGRIALGADAGSNPGALQYPFRGRLADVHIWEAVPAIPSPALLAQATGDDLPAYIDRGVPEGTYIYSAEPIDIFGRMGTVASSPAVTVRDEVEPPPPAGARAAFVPFTGRITSVAGDEIATDIALPAGVAAASLAGHDLELQAPDGRGGVLRERLPIESAWPVAGGTAFRVAPPPFPRVRPELGVEVSVEYDAHLRVQWSWTGLQRLFAPRARAFHVYVRKGAVNRREATVVSASRTAFNRFLVRLEPRLDVSAAGVAGTRCLVGPFMYTIEAPPSASWDAELRYNAAPVQEPRPGQPFSVNLPDHSPLYVDPADKSAWERAGGPVPLRAPVVIEWVGRAAVTAVSAEEKERLRQAGVQWIATDAQVYSLSLSDSGRLSSGPRPRPDAYVPGGFVAFNETDGEWKAFSVLWHDWESTGTVRLYFSHAGDSPPHLSDVRYCPGERYELLVPLADAPRLAAARGTLEVSAAAATVDDRGIEGPLSDAARAVAVNRMRPPTPPRPVVTRVDRPDFHGNSRATVEWTLPADVDWQGVSFQLYRASDADVAACDLEQRRTRSGAYRSAEPREVFADDPDFDAWIAATEMRLGIPGLAANWSTFLFPQKPSEDRPQREPAPGTPGRAVWEKWTAWDAATPVWQAWAERFYPSLTDDELVAVAERAGNEKAFTLVTDTPITSRRHVDSITGRVRNKWLYRLRSVSNTLLPSAEWSSVSLPVATRVNAPPRPPSFTKIEAADRRVTLHWTLDRGPWIREYRLYRAERQEALEDLRHFSESPDPRVVAVVPDPLVRVHGRKVSLPGSLAIAEVQGVYRLDEFDFEATDPAHQPAALNYYNPAPTSPAEIQSRFTPAASEAESHVIEGLRRIADGTPVVVVYRDAEGALHRFAQAGAPPYEDDRVVGGRDYYYRLIAVDVLGQLSAGSKIVRARPFEITRPAAPALTVTRERVSDDTDRVTVTCRADGAELEITLRRRPSSNPVWTTAVHWTAFSGTYVHVEDVPTGEIVEYRAYCRTPGNLVSEPSRIAVAVPTIDLLGERA